MTCREIIKIPSTVENMSKGISLSKVTSCTPAFWTTVMLPLAFFARTKQHMRNGILKKLKLCDDITGQPAVEAMLVAAERRLTPTSRLR